MTEQTPEPQRGSEPSRRLILGVGGAGLLAVGALGLAACSAKASSGTSGGGDPATSSDAPSTPSGGSTGASSDAPSASGDGGSVIAPLASVPVGGSVNAKLDGKPIVLSQQNAGTVTAFTAICTHMGCTVNAGGAQLNCPCHGSVYNAFTGQVIQGPAPSPLAAVPVKVVGSSIEAG